MIAVGISEGSGKRSGSDDDDDEVTGKKKRKVVISDEEAGSPGKPTSGAGSGTLHQFLHFIVV